MKILLVHNYYQARGGEDAVFEAERDLLLKNNLEVETFVLNNKSIDSGADKIRAGFGTFYNHEAAGRLGDRMRAFRPDVVHVHNFFPLISPAVFDVASKFGVPAVMTVHNFRLVCANAMLFRDGEICESCIAGLLPWQGIWNACYRGSRTQSAVLTGAMLYHRWSGTWRNKVSGYIALTEFAREKLIAAPLELPPTRVHVKPNFVEDCSDPPSIGRGKQFLFVGRLSPEKGIETLLQAFVGSDARLQIIGTGPLEDHVRQVSDQAPNIEYKGFMDKAGIMDALSTARALIVPSLWYEGFPMVIVEALSTGTPVLVSAIGGLPEIIRDGHNGLHLQPGSVPDIQDKVKLLLEDEPLHRQLCLNAKSAYRERYSPEVNYRMLNDIYERVKR
jgi:glycosyltransferase involved in cell wall biosynthesis